ncbi:ADI_G0039780.mRNA.1.CDS.1 [Saccharomyces cerevisiae]|nr:ADI_G0039780.mRNA.1.CDS.1 [Saccharomyces cerevisiae]CAI6829223.1 ADI_G0039780.mRNA.1.CDS.1 [Saccharomyces cerevisiae]
MTIFFKRPFLSIAPVLNFTTLISQTFRLRRMTGLPWDQSNKVIEGQCTKSFLLFRADSNSSKFAFFKLTPIGNFHFIFVSFEINNSMLIVMLFDKKSINIKQKIVQFPSYII